MKCSRYFFWVPYIDEFVGTYYDHPIQQPITLDYRIAVGLRLFIISTFSQAYALIRYPTFINFPTHAAQYKATDIVRMSYKYVHCK